MLGVVVFKVFKADGELGSSSQEHSDTARCLFFHEAITAVRAGLPGAEEGLPVPYPLSIDGKPGRNKL